ncbi:hypothetical protein AL1_07510 [Alistipes shahii WAL 8301]|uniref:Uncharacterized protein n=1 Tax=Alistipes shahii WAL 8301 TaxID=717959 RepID=D4IK61_9BACT|nr:hypothetical protein AL1_07510 [Alistipes shahii WAL 8301]
MGRSEMPTSRPEGFSRQEPPQMEMLPGKKVVVFAPARFWRCYR